MPLETIPDVGAPRPVVKLEAKDFKGKVDPDWCPGCGDFGVLAGLQKVCAELGLHPHQIVTVSGIGCSSNSPGFFNAYGIHTPHGPAPPAPPAAHLRKHRPPVIPPDAH